MLIQDPSFASIEHFLSVSSLDDFCLYLLPSIVYVKELWTLYFPCSKLRCRSLNVTLWSAVSPSILNSNFALCQFHVSDDWKLRVFWKALLHWQSVVGILVNFKNWNYFYPSCIWNPHYGLLRHDSMFDSAQLISHLVECRSSFPGRKSNGGWTWTAIKYGLEQLRSLTSKPFHRTLCVMALCWLIGDRCTCKDSDGVSLDRDPSFLIMFLKHGNEQETAV
jgi:hypothetical protein